MGELRLGVPQASKKLRDYWESDQRAIAYLKGRGFILTRDWHWVKPSELAISEKDQSSIGYMIHEYDFGGWIHPSDAEIGIDGYLRYKK